MTSQPSSTRMQWTDQIEICFLESYAKSSEKGLKTDSGFKAQAHQNAISAVKQDFNVVINKDQCKAKLQQQKKKYKVWHVLRDQSGFGIDFETGDVSAPEEVWDKYIEVRSTVCCRILFSEYSIY